MSNQDAVVAPVEAVHVTIFNKTYSLRSHRGSEYVQQIARIVDERMRQISSQITTHDVAKIAVLAALNIADEMQTLQDYYEKDEQELKLPSAEDGPGTSSEADAAASLAPAAQPPSASSQSSQAAEPQSWFEAIFDSAEPARERTERLSSQISAKLKMIRHNGQEANILEAEEEK